MKIITGNWHLMRVIRLVLALVIIGQAWYYKEVIAGVLGLILLAMAIWNVACCGPTGCYTPIRGKSKESPKNIDYEEVV